jgi:hypothetical protein
MAGIAYSPFETGNSHCDVLKNIRKPAVQNKFESRALARNRSLCDEFAMPLFTLNLMLLFVFEKNYATK